MDDNDKSIKSWSNAQEEENTRGESNKTKKDTKVGQGGRWGETVRDKNIKTKRGKDSDDP